MTARMPSYNMISDCILPNEGDVYPDSISDQKVRIENRDNSLFSCDNFEVACNAITYPDLIVSTMLWAGKT